jgi:hypothetical protein
MPRQWARIGGIAVTITLLLVLILNLKSLGPRFEILEQRPIPDEQTEIGQAQDEEHEAATGGNGWLNGLKDWAKPPSINELLYGSSKSATQSSTTTVAAFSTSDGAATTLTEATTSTSTSTTSTSTESTPSPTGTTRAVVMGKLSKEDTDWVGDHLKDWQSYIYVVDLPTNASSPTGLRTKINKSKEAYPYLTYIIDHYPNFPDVMLFIHAHRSGWPQAWHNDAKNYDAVNMLHDLRLDTVLDRGYVNLRCQSVPGCPDEIQPYRFPPDPDKVPEQIFPFVYAEFFNVPLSEVRKEVEVVATQCCAQFAVSKEQVLKRPKEDYERFRDYIEKTPYDDDTIGRVLEYMWHIMFGAPAVQCEATSSCWCNVYGRCSKGWNVVG